MAEYICTQNRTVIVEANSAAEARTKSEAVFYARPGFDKELRRSMQYSNVNVEKRRN